MIQYSCVFHVHRNVFWKLNVKHFPVSVVYAKCIKEETNNFLLALFPALRLYCNSLRNVRSMNSLRLMMLFYVFLLWFYLNKTHLENKGY